jgi:putative SOS response-associated peptidase YedK
LPLEHGSGAEPRMRESLERAAEMMKPYSGAIHVWQVSSTVGNVKNNGPELMERVAQEAPALDV